MSTHPNNPKRNFTHWKKIAVFRAANGNEEALEKLQTAARKRKETMEPKWDQQKSN